MFKVMVCGAGEIGRFVAVLLAQSASYDVTLVDKRPQDATLEHLCKQYPTIKYKELSVTDEGALDKLIRENEFTAILSCLHSLLNIPLVKAALNHNLHFFNLCEDVEIKAQIIKLAKNASNVFVLQCGIAPGAVNIIAHRLISRFDTVNSATLSVGALPHCVNNAIHYELSWSIDGLINEYMQPCRVIEKGVDKAVPALSGLEVFNTEGQTYELFHTSGGLGTLDDLYKDTIQNLHYKSIRYPGHARAMQALFAENGNDFQKMRDWFSKNIPFTKQDVVLMYVSVTGTRDNEFCEQHFFHKWYPRILNGTSWTAIQWTTASEICAMCDLVLCDPQAYQGIVKHEDVDYEAFSQNRFMRYYELND